MSVIPLENGIQVKGMGMDPGFHRGDDKAGMTGKRVDFQSTNSEPLGLEPRVVQFDVCSARAGIILDLPTFVEYDATT